MPADEPAITAAAPSPLAAGAMLAAAREAAGLSVESVAAQLKLAPRQVRALESGDFSALPGRTFVRGFVRNYARHVGLEPASVLAALPDDSDPALSHPHLAGTHRPMGEIPAEHARRRSYASWLIAVALAACVAVAVVVEKWRPVGERDAAPAGTSIPLPETPGRGAGEPASPAASPATGSPAGSQAPSPDGAALPSADAARSAVAPQSTGASAPAPAAPAPAAPAPATTPSQGTPLPNPVTRPAGASTSSTPAPASTASVAPPPAAAPPLAVATPPGPGAVASPERARAAGATTLELAFHGTSWVEVKDARGVNVLTLTGNAGTSRSLEATPPLDIVIGNAGDVDLRFRGASVDLAPYMRQNVARLTLR